MKHVIVCVLLAGCVDEPELAETSAAVSSLVLEAESATGAGSIETDASASGGALRVLTVAGTFAQQTFVTTGLTASGSVRVRGEACQPWLRLRIDGNDVLVTQVGAGWIDIPFTTYVPAGMHTLQLHHRFGACALRIDQVTLTVEDPPPPPPPPVVVEAETAVGQGTVVASPAESGGAYRAFSAAYQKASTTFTTTASTTGTVRVRASGCTSAPIAKVTIDGSVATMTQITGGAWTSLALGTRPSGTHAIEFEYRYGLAGCAVHFDHATFAP